MGHTWENKNRAAYRVSCTIGTIVYCFSCEQTYKTLEQKSSCFLAFKPRVLTPLYIHQVSPKMERWSHLQKKMTPFSESGTSFSENGDPFFPKKGSLFFLATHANPAEGENKAESLIMYAAAGTILLYCFSCEKKYKNSEININFQVRWLSSRGYSIHHIHPGQAAQKKTGPHCFFVVVPILRRRKSIYFQKKWAPFSENRIPVLPALPIFRKNGPFLEKGTPFSLNLFSEKGIPILPNLPIFRKKWAFFFWKRDPFVSKPHVTTQKQKGKKKRCRLSCRLQSIPYCPYCEKKKKNRSLDSHVPWLSSRRCFVLHWAPIREIRKWKKGPHF